jgi:hypothetical protein
MLARQSQARVALDIPLRGARDYVHSTDLFGALDALADQLVGPNAHLKTLRLRRLAYRQVVAQFEPHADAFGSFAFAARGRLVEGWLVEDPAPITGRIAFDEAAIARQAVSEQGRVFLRSPVQGYSSFEQLIVLIKMLCAQSLAGHWLFTSIDLDGPLLKEAALAVSRTQLVLGRMMDAMLYQDGSPGGRMQMVIPAAGDIA